MKNRGIPPKVAAHILQRRELEHTPGTRAGRTVHPHGTRADRTEHSHDTAATRTEHSHDTRPGRTEHSRRTGADVNETTPLGAGSEIARPESELFRGGLVARRLPSIGAALLDTSLAPISPAELGVPESIVASLRAAKRVLVIGHVPPDADTFGSALGLSRALRLLGKEADVCIDAPTLAGELRRLRRPGEVIDAATAQAKDYDLVLVVDACDGDRLGDGAAKIVAAADRVIVLDHHNYAPTNERLGRRPDAPFEAWWNKGGEAASLMAAGITERLLEGVVERQSVRYRDVVLPMIGGILQDTDDFKQSGCSLLGLRALKYLLLSAGFDRLGDAKAALAYRLPPRARQLLRGEVVMDGAVLEERSLRGAGFLVARRGLLEKARAVAREVDPDVTEDDVRGHLMQLLDLATEKHTPLTALLYEDSLGLGFSARSREAQTAIDFAEVMGGGGRAHSAGARPKLLLEEAIVEVERFIKVWAADREARLRVGRSR
ncbi:MAG: DHH family phosphoesterase [Deltaproteobacteria bacterium]|nr:DHH family phosphoesterase [Deltaproteobacteria bacterium]